MSELRNQIADSIHESLIDSKPVTTIKAIAQVTGIPRGTIYKYGMNDGQETDEPCISRFIRMFNAAPEDLLPTLKFIVSLCDPSLYLSRLSASETLDGNTEDEFRRVISEVGHVAEKASAIKNDRELDLDKIREAREEINHVRHELNDLDSEYEQMEELVSGPAIEKTRIGSHVRRMEK